MTVKNREFFSKSLTPLTFLHYLTTSPSPLILSPLFNPSSFPSTLSPPPQLFLPPPQPFHLFCVMQQNHEFHPQPIDISTSKNLKMFSRHFDFNLTNCKPFCTLSNNVKSTCDISDNLKKLIEDELMDLRRAMRSLSARRPQSQEMRRRNSIIDCQQRLLVSGRLVVHFFIKINAFSLYYILPIHTKFAFLTFSQLNFLFL